MIYIDLVEEEEKVTKMMCMCMDESLFMSLMEDPPLLEAMLFLFGLGGRERVCVFVMCSLSKRVMRR